MDWSEEYQKLIDNPPGPGAILTTADGSPVRLDRTLADGKPPFVYGRAYVPEIVGSMLGWFLQSNDGKKTHGWKCILLPKARQQCFRKLGMTNEILLVKSLRVVRKSQTGKSLLCEVAEYL